jgi:hypothetical protein
MTHQDWQELYKAAMLELRPEELGQRIEAAESAIQQRLQELSATAAVAGGEHHALADALRGLRTLAKTECKPTAVPPIQAMVQPGLAS